MKQKQLLHNIYLFWLLLGGLAIGSGWLFALLGLPAAWFLGPMIVAGVLATWRATQTDATTGSTTGATAAVDLPNWQIVIGHAVLGGAVSTTMTPEALELFGTHWLAIVLTVVGLLGCSVLSSWLLVQVGQIDAATALLGMMPGGAPGMVALSDALDADSRLVAVMQMLRVMIVLGTLAIVAAVVVPGSSGASAVQPGLDPTWSDYLVTVAITVMGAAGGLLLRVPAGALVGPALLGAVAGLVGLVHPPWPPLVLIGSYILIGISIGLRFNVQSFHDVGRLLPAFLISTMALVVGAVLLAGLLALFAGVDLFSAYLATLPGGISAVMIVALDSGSDVVLVLTINLLRFLVIVLAGPWVVRWLVGWFAPVPASDPQ